MKLNCTCVDMSFPLRINFYEWEDLYVFVESIGWVYVGVQEGKEGDDFVRLP